MCLMFKLAADSYVQVRNPSETRKSTRANSDKTRSKSGFIRLVALAKGTKRDMHGSLSVLSMLSGIVSSMWVGNGMVTKLAAVSDREVEMKGRFKGVVMIVTESLRWRRRRARWRSGMVWPLDINGKRTACGEDATTSSEPMSAVSVCFLTCVGELCCWFK
ncbi:hypothetical protein QQ045_024846 [Rhodiola kirilowii]